MKNRRGKQEATAHSRISTARLLAFAGPNIPTGLMHGPARSVLPTIYASFFGVELEAIAGILLVSRIFDAITDPLIGYLSDRTRSRIGRRKPWIVAGTLMSMISVYFLYVPPENPGSTYFLFWFLAVYLAWTVSEVPFAAWTVEITHDYDERARVVTFRNIVALLGTALFFTVPLLPFFETTAITPEVLEFIAWATVVILPATIVFAVLYAPEGSNVEIRESVSLRDLYWSVRRNRPFWVFIGVFVLAGIGSGMFAAMSFLYMSHYLQMADKYIYILGAVMITALVALPMWLKIIRRVGKHKAWAASLLISLLVMPLVLLLEPGPGAFIPFLVISIVIGLASSAFQVAPEAVFGDIVDYDILKTGSNRAAKYSALYTLVNKANVALGSAGAFFIVGVFGYDATVGATNDATGILGLKLAYIVIPTVILLPTVYLIWRFPIDRRRQSIIQRRLERRSSAGPTAGQKSSEG